MTLGLVYPRLTEQASVAGLGAVALEMCRVRHVTCGAVLAGLQIARGKLTVSARVAIGTFALIQILGNTSASDQTYSAVPARRSGAAELLMLLLVLAYMCVLAQFSVMILTANAFE